MLAELIHNWWVFLVRGLAAIIFGALALVWPTQAWLALVLVFGAFVALDGILTIIAGIDFKPYFDRWWAILLQGVAGVAIGVLTLLWPRPASQVLFYLVAAWAIITGIFEIVAATHIRLFIFREWTMILTGILSIIFGILLFVYPSPGLIGLVWVIGLYALVYGIMQIIFSARLHGLRKLLPGT